jgi:hypothetical protein
MKSLLNKIVGLQNDLIGLDKDLEVGEPMNVVVVLGGLWMQQPDSPNDKQQVMKESVREADVMHDMALNKAIDKWKTIHRGSNMECEKELSDTIMLFVERFSK